MPETSRATRRTAVLVVAGIAAAAAVVSYSHALQVVRWSGTTNWLAFVVPLLPDGLILLSSLALYEAAQARAARPRWATVGLVLGCGVTVVMNVAAGWPHRPGGALVNALAPVVLVLALEILASILRRGRPAPDGPLRAECDHQPALNLDDAIRAAAPFLPQRQLADAFRVSKTTVARKTTAALNGGR
jgi:hypothetical protein